MKKHCWYLFLIILLLVSCGCSSGTTAIFEIDSLEFNSSEYDADMRYVRSYGNMCRNGDVYYISLNNFLWYYDEVSGLYGKLCGKPECTHDTETCNAFIKFKDRNGVQIYDNKLYYGDGQGGLYCVGLDGSGRELVAGLWNGNGSNFKWMIHRGYLYQTGNYYVVENGQDKLNLKIARKSMKKNAEEEVLIEIPDMRALDNWLIQDDKLFLDISYGAWGKREFYMYDLEKGELTKLIDEKFNGYIADYLVDEEGITFLGRTWDEHYVFRYSFAEKTKNEWFRVKTELDTNSRLSADGKYVIIYDTKNIKKDGSEKLFGKIYDVYNDKTPMCTYEIPVEERTGSVIGWGSDEKGFYLERYYISGKDILYDIWRISYGGEAKCLIKTESIYKLS